jgi:peroxiredoxin
MRLFQALAISILVAGSAAAVTVPRPAPEFAVQMPNGSQILLTQYRGKVVLMEFLYTTCPHCQNASRIMNKLQAEYGPRGFQAIGVAFNEMAKMLVPDFVRDFNVSYPVGFSPREPITNFLQANENEALHVPQLVFIDKKGFIRHQSQPRGDSITATEPNMRKMIEQLLAEPAPASSRRTSGPAKKKTS